MPGARGQEETHLGLRSTEILALSLVGEGLIEQNHLGRLIGNLHYSAIGGPEIKSLGGGNQRIS